MSASARFASCGEKNCAGGGFASTVMGVAVVGFKSRGGLVRLRPASGGFADSGTGFGETAFACLSVRES
jgi:hypothetical protein